MSKAAQLREKLVEPLSSSAIRTTFGIAKVEKRKPAEKYAPLVGPSPPQVPVTEVPPIKLPETIECLPPPRTVVNKKPKMGDLATDDW
jgi:hypothetical protein